MIKCSGCTRKRRPSDVRFTLQDLTLETVSYLCNSNCLSTWATRVRVAAQRGTMTPNPAA